MLTLCEKKAAWTALLLACTLGGANIWAKRSSGGKLFAFEQGQKWRMEDLMSAHVPDPETGKFITPVTRSIFGFKVYRMLPDGTAVVSTKVTQLESGITQEQLNQLPLDPPDKPAQILLMTPDGRVYGPYSEKDELKTLETMPDLDSWLQQLQQQQQEPKPWVWHKIPLNRIAVGASVERRLADETWVITHLKDEIVSGILCDVYKSRLKRNDISVSETTWYYSADKYLVKREIVEKRAKEVSANLVQRRMM